MSVKLTNEMIQAAKATETKYGVPASITLGQIMLESGGSYSGGLSGLAYNYNNLFGITAGSSWTGKTIYMTNKQGKDGQTYRVYNNVLESIDDHGKLLSNSNYTSHTKGATTIQEYAQGIKDAGYATDPNYVTKLMNVIKTNNLTQYDSGKIGGVTADTLSTSSENNPKGNSVESDNNTNLFGSIVVVTLSILVIGVGILFFTKSLGIDIGKKGIGGIL